jgi:hypothetical protein
MLEEQHCMLVQRLLDFVTVSCLRSKVGSKDVLSKGV